MSNDNLKTKDMTLGASNTSGTQNNGENGGGIPANSRMFHMTDIPGIIEEIATKDRYIQVPGLGFIKVDKNAAPIGSQGGSAAPAQTAGWTMGNFAPQMISNMGGMIGHIDPYKPSEEWKIYEERFEQYCTANFIPDGQRKVSALLTLLGTEVHKTLKDLCHPDAPHNKNYKDLCEILGKHFSPRISIFKERKKFYELRQQNPETINAWYARIKKAAIDCDFKNELEGRLKDQFVTGLHEGKIADRLFEESPAKKTLNELIDLALTKEATLKKMSNTSINKVSAYSSQKSAKKQRGAQEAANGSGKGSSSGGGGKSYATAVGTPAAGSTNNYAARSQQQRIVRGRVKKGTCWHCGKDEEHDYKNCKFKTQACRKCNQIGHIGSICPGVKNNNNSNNYIEENIIQEYVGLNNISL